MRQIQSGKTEMYAELVRRYQDRIFNTCWRICGNLEDARDLTQDAFIKAFLSIQDFRGKSGFYTWLYRIAVNLTLSHRRQQKNRGMVSIDQAVDSEGTQASALADRLHHTNDDQHGESVERAELHHQVAFALQQLDLDQRCVVVLRDIEGLDYRQIAVILDIAPGTVKSRLHRARMALREALSESGGDE